MTGLFLPDLLSLILLCPHQYKIHKTKLFHGSVLNISHLSKTFENICFGKKSQSSSLNISKRWRINAVKVLSFCQSQSYLLSHWNKTIFVPFFPPRHNPASVLHLNASVSTQSKMDQFSFFPPLFSPQFSPSRYLSIQSSMPRR